MASQAQQAPAAIVRSPPTLSIRARLMILAVIAIVPLVLERVHNERFDRNERMEAAHKEVLALAQRTASAQYDVIVSTRTLLQVLANTRVVSPTDPACNSHAEKHRRAGPMDQDSVGGKPGREDCLHKQRNCARPRHRHACAFHQRD